MVALTFISIGPAISEDLETLKESSGWVLTKYTDSQWQEEVVPYVLIWRTLMKLKKFAQYSSFRVGGALTKYTLTVSGYSGDAKDGMAYHNGMKFSTHDNDNDLYSKNCALSFKGAWWYNNCHQSNLNGQYLAGQHSMTYADGINWYLWKGYHYSLKMTEMKLRS